MPPVETVAIISKPGVGRARRLAPELLEWLRRRGVRVRCDQETAEYVPGEPGIPRYQVSDGADLVILLGGDGTLLSAARAVRNRDIPLFPVNLGSLGFLTAIGADEIFAELEKALRGEVRISDRRLLRCSLVRQGKPFSEYEALNDVVVDKVDIARMIDVDASVDGQYVCAYKADGLIIATPTGSTAYSLSAGGPIIFPSVAALAITPICPHTLTNRPVIVPETSEIELISRNRDGAAYLTIDGQVGEPLKRDDVVICRRAEKCLRLIRHPDLKFFDVLRLKLKWGER